jgi:hypothetical protein
MPKKVMFKKLQEDLPQDQTLQAAAEVVCVCTCKTEDPKPGEETVEANSNGVNLGVDYDLNGGTP